MWSVDDKVEGKGDEAAARTQDPQPPLSSLTFNQRYQLFSQTPGRIIGLVKTDGVITLPFIEDQQQEKSMAIACLLCFVPLLGMFGAHHFYLNRPLLGVFYASSMGMLGIGWLVDCFRVPFLVRDCNAELREAKERGTWLYDYNKYGLLSKRSVVDAYLLWLPYLGSYGLYHFILGRPMYGLLQALALGLNIPGWLVDFFRIPYLVHKANQEIEQLKNTTPNTTTTRATTTTATTATTTNEPITREVNVLDAYLTAIPMGLFGLHHFYLGNYKRGFVYLCTMGVFGLGLLADMFMMPMLVRHANMKKVTSGIQNW